MTVLAKLIKILAVMWFEEEEFSILTPLNIAVPKDHFITS
jgi:hypothetical protein